jgi:hypothetical protein
MVASLVRQLPQSHAPRVRTVNCKQLRGVAGPKEEYGGEGGVGGLLRLPSATLHRMVGGTRQWKPKRPKEGCEGHSFGSLEIFP